MAGKRKPVIVTDYLGGKRIKVVARFNTIAEAEACIVGLHYLDKTRVEAGMYGIDAPETLVNPPK